VLVLFLRSYYGSCNFAKRMIYKALLGRKMLKLIQAISKKDQVVAAIKEAILSALSDQAIRSWRAGWRSNWAAEYPCARGAYRSRASGICAKDSL